MSKNKTAPEIEALRANAYDQMVKPGPVNVHFGAVDSADALVLDMIRRGF